MIDMNYRLKITEEQSTLIWIIISGIKNLTAIYLANLTISRYLQSSTKYGYQILTRIKETKNPDVIRFS